MEFGVHPFHRVQFQVADPGFSDKLAHQLSNQSGMTEQPVVERVMIGHLPSFNVNSVAVAALAGG
jgi:hypothetical protein